MPLGNVLATLTITALQVTVLVVAAVLRGATLHTSAAGLLWFAVAALLLAAAVAGISEIMVFRLRSQEEYVGLTPAVAIIPWFFAGSLFPIAVLPRGLADFAKLLPTTHALAVMRYGLVGGSSTGLQTIWGHHSSATLAAASLGIVVGFAVLLFGVATRVFRRSALP